MDHFRVRVAQDAAFVVPGRTLKEESVEVAAVNRRHPVAHRLILKFEHLVGEVDFVDRILVLSGVVLLDASQERLGEEETGDPEAIGFVVLNPLFIDRDALLEVVDVSEKRLARWVGSFEPLFGNAVVLDALQNLIRFRV